MKLAGDRQERAAMAQDLARRAGAARAGVVGRIAILYRPHPDPSRRGIQLDGSSRS